MRRKDKEARKNMTQNQKSDVDGEGKKGKEMIQNQKSEVDNNRNKGKDQHGSVEKTLLIKEQHKDIN
ncbi:hypothetical protein HAX54_039496, partial [Datura stramonium]|nr:hypothetical protein [Datura stramonium]